MDSAPKPPNVSLNRSALEALLARPANLVRLDGGEYIEAALGQICYTLRWSTIPPLNKESGYLVRTTDFAEYAAAVRLVLSRLGAPFLRQPGTATSALKPKPVQSQRSARKAKRA